MMPQLSPLSRLTWSWLVPAILVFALILLPLWSHAVGDRYYIALVARMIIYAIAATALHLALGLAGFLALCGFYLRYRHMPRFAPWLQPRLPTCVSHLGCV